jgi:hypothetical protein
MGPKVPESFNVLVKELQGLGLRVDLLDESEDAIIDAEAVLAGAMGTASAPATPVTPTVANLDMTDEMTADEFEDIDLEDGMTIRDAEDEELAVTEVNETQEEA